MNKPLAIRMRPKTINEVIGQKHLLSENSFIKNSIEQKNPFSIIFFGPPGCGKTTIAEAYANDLHMHIIKLNGTISNKKEIEAAIEESKIFKPTVIIIDEIHRLNKDRQDLLLPYLENGSFYLIGATTSNPYLYINKALRSRCHLLEIKPLEDNDVFQGLKNAINTEKSLQNLNINDEVLAYLAKIANGDLRYAYNMLEITSISFSNNEVVSLDKLKDVVTPRYNGDLNEDSHYDCVSALQKSIRGSDVDAALFYLAQLCIVKDLPSIARRLTVIAYEDVGFGNPQAVDRVLNAIQAAENVGFPEAKIPLSFAVCELALSPKSRTAVDSINTAIEFVSQNQIPVPPYLRYTPVNMEEADKYPYDRQDLWMKIQYLPEQIKNKQFYKQKGFSKYEQALNDNYKIYKNNKRSSNLRKLKNDN